jgi:hypothetical protein
MAADLVEDQRGDQVLVAAGIRTASGGDDILVATATSSEQPADQLCPRASSPHNNIPGDHPRPQAFPRGAQDLIRRHADGPGLPGGEFFFHPIDDPVDRQAQAVHPRERQDRALVSEALAEVLDPPVPRVHLEARPHVLAEPEVRQP